WQGRAGESVELFRSLIEAFPGASVYPAVLAWALAEHGEVDDAQAIVDDFRTRGFADMRDYMRLVGLVSVARAASRLGDTDASAALHKLLLPFRGTMATSQAAWFGPVTHDLGLLATTLGRYDEADTHFADAVEIQDRIHARGMVLHTRLEWARMLLRRGQAGETSRARTLLEEASAGARDVGVPAIETRIEELQRQIGD
ncbi:MAG: tetratricopeptide repeat protein, partial [Actinobacteria bacterium]|nr:tetratricopeptide repeat protein [Actinomycetota bacterium]